MRLAARRSEWVVGVADESRWSRLAHPTLFAWCEAPLRLMTKPPEKMDPDPKALACYGLLRSDPPQMLVRFVKGRPVSHATTACLAWLAERLAQEGERLLVVVWGNAAWHGSKEVRAWIKAHNRQVKQKGGVRLLVCRLPVKRPWLNPIEPHWLHGKRDRGTNPHLDGGRGDAAGA